MNITLNKGNIPTVNKVEVIGDKGSVYMKTISDESIKETVDQMDESIKETVDQMFVEKILLFSQIDIYRATSGLPKEGLRVLTFTDYLILGWIREIIDMKTGACHTGN